MRKFITVLLLLFFTSTSSIVICQKLNKTDFCSTIENGKFVPTFESVNEKLTGMLSQYWIPNEWHDGGRFLYEYSNAGHMTSMYMDSLHNGEWKTLMSIIVEYDGVNKPITDITRIYDVDGSEEWATKNVTSYSGDYADESLQYSWDLDANDWVLNGKQIYEYENNLVSKISDFTWNDFTNAWDPEFENYFTFDNQGREIEGLSKKWDSQESTFVNSGLSLTEYHKDHLISKRENKSWDIATNEWSTDNFNIILNQYNGNDKVIESVFTYSMGFVGFSFTMKDSTIYEYDTSNYLIIETEYSWQDVVGYIPFTKVEHNNDASGEVIDEIFYLHSGSDTWVPYEKHIYAYDGTVAVEDLELLPIEFFLDQNYPNPFNPETIISYNVGETSEIKLNIYDILGNFITTLVNGEHGAGRYSVDFNASKLSSGTYIISLNNGNHVITKKCLLLK